MSMEKPHHPTPDVLEDAPGTITADDVYLFREGSHFGLYEKLGAHLVVRNGVPGVTFAVWAPEARGVSVIGDFNGWDPACHALAMIEGSGIWTGFIPGLSAGTVYKYHVVSRHRSYSVDKADPFAFSAETPPRTASIVRELDYDWGDAAWMETRASRNSIEAPIAIYEMHVGSWRRILDDGAERPLTYREIAEPLVRHLRDTGFTHVEFLPLMEHPFYGSWGYQTTGHFAPTGRYGSPQDLMFLIDTLHRNDIGVIFDWVPSHFPNDEHGLTYFDGTHLFEHADPRQGYHPDWNSSIFNYGRREVQSFLISSAFFWFDRYHIDAIRVDAVASMLYLDYSRRDGEWIPNRHGGRENLEAIAFLKRLNAAVYDRFPGVLMIAEESTAWPMVSRPLYLGGLGFGLKWDMGWMHDTLHYLGLDPIHRRHHHANLTFRGFYAFSENFLLPLSHDEVVYGKGSLFGRMPGTPREKCAHLRLLFALQYGQPGKKLLFMGGEFGQPGQWNHDASLNWAVLDDPDHRGVLAWIRDLNGAYRNCPTLHRNDCHESGFEWIDANDDDQSVVSFLRRGAADDPPVAVVAHFTPVLREGYRVGVPEGGFWRELLNGDAADYGGRGIGNMGGVEAEEIPAHGRPWSIRITIPGLAALFFIREGKA